MILYFSGTGNSKYAAEKIAEVLQDKIFSINDSMKQEEKAKLHSEKPLVFAVPTYAWRIPRVVEKWIEDAEFSGSRKAYFVMTCGENIGNAEKYIKKLCEKKQFEYMGCAEIVMPENFITMFKAPEKAEAIQIIQKAEPFIEKAAKKIAAGQKLDVGKITWKDNISSGIVNDIFYPLFVNAKKFYATEECIGCNICAKKCPLNNIELADGKPKWGENCTQCMACICDCPREAIEFGNRAKGKVRYHFPI